MFMFRLDIYAAEPWYHVTSVTLTIQCLQLQHVRANKASLQSLSVSSFTTPPSTTDTNDLFITKYPMRDLLPFLKGTNLNVKIPNQDQNLIVSENLLY